MTWPAQFLVPVARTNRPGILSTLARGASLYSRQKTMQKRITALRDWALSPKWDLCISTTITTKAQEISWKESKSQKMQMHYGMLSSKHDMATTIMNSQHKTTKSSQPKPPPEMEEVISRLHPLLKFLPKASWWGRENHLSFEQCPWVSFPCGSPTPMCIWTALTTFSG